MRRDGSRFWADVVLTSIRDSSGEIIGFSKVTRDFTDRKRAEEAVMLQLSSALLANLDVRKLLGAISASISEVIPHDSATLGLYDHATGTLRVQFLTADAGGSPRGEVLRALGNSAAGEAYRTRAPVVLDVISASSFPTEGVRHLANLGMQSGCWVPLVHRGDVIGVLAVASRMEASFSQHDAEMLAQVADQVAMAVNNALAFRQIAELRDRLTQEKRSRRNQRRECGDVVGEGTSLRVVLKGDQTGATTTRQC